MASDNGGRAWIGTVAALAAVTVFGTTAGGIAGYQKAQDVAEQQRQWFEGRISTLRAEVTARRTEIRAEALEERRALEARLNDLLDAKIDIETGREMMHRLSDHTADMRRR